MCTGEWPPTPAAALSTSGFFLLPSLPFWGRLGYCFLPRRAFAYAIMNGTSSNPCGLASYAARWWLRVSFFAGIRGVAAGEAASIPLSLAFPRHSIGIFGGSCFPMMPALVMVSCRRGCFGAQPSATITLLGARFAGSGGPPHLLTFPRGGQWPVISKGK